MPQCQFLSQYGPLWTGPVLELCSLVVVPLCCFWGEEGAVFPALGPAAFHKGCCS